MPWTQRDDGRWSFVTEYIYSWDDLGVYAVWIWMNILKKCCFWSITLIKSEIQAQLFGSNNFRNHSKWGLLSCTSILRIYSLSQAWADRVFFTIKIHDGPSHPWYTRVFTYCAWLDLRTDWLTNLSHPVSFVAPYKGGTNYTFIILTCGCSLMTSHNSYLSFTWQKYFTFQREQSV